MNTCGQGGIVGATRRVRCGTVGRKVWSWKGLADDGGPQLVGPGIGWSGHGREDLLKMTVICNLQTGVGTDEPEELEDV